MNNDYLALLGILTFAGFLFSVALLANYGKKLRAREEERRKALEE